MHVDFSILSIWIFHGNGTLQAYSYMHPEIKLDQHHDGRLQPFLFSRMVCPVVLAETL